MGLAEFFKHFLNFINCKLLSRQAPGNILVHAKINTAVDYLFALSSLRKLCKLTFKNIFTFQMPLQESVVETIINSQIHLRTFYVGHEHAWNILHLRWLEKKTSWSCSCSELDDSSYALESS